MKQTIALVDDDRNILTSVSMTLEQEGFLVAAIRPPTVAAGTARLRITFTAQHQDADIERLAGIIRHRLLPQRS